MLFTIDLHKYFINVEGIAKSLMLSLQSPGIFGSKFDTPESDGFVANCDAPFSQQVLNITVTQVEPVIHPDGVTDDVRWKSMTFVGIHPEIIHFRELSCQYR